LIDIVATLNTLPCLDPTIGTLRNGPSSNSTYPLMNVTEAGCGVYGSDPASMLIDNTSETLFYT